MTERFILAFDDEHICIRKTLCVTHDGNKGEVIYHAKPTQIRLKRLIKLQKLLNDWIEELRKP